MTKISNVRKATKFKRSIKAISPVIATLLMIAIAVVASLVVYAWVGGYMDFTTSKAGKAIAIPSLAGVSSEDENFGDLVVYVQNVGQGTVEVSAVYVDDALIDIAALKYSPKPPGPVISEGNTVEVTIDGNFDLTIKHNIKVTTTDGTFMTTTGKPGTGGSTSSGTLAASVTPAGPLSLGVGETQEFSVAVSGGTGAKSYVWYLDTVVVAGQILSTYTYTASTSGSPHSVYCRVTDSATTPVSVNSNAVSITVNSAQPKMHVASIVVTIENYLIIERGRAVVTIVDSSGSPVSGADVSATWSGATGGDVYGSTDGNGEVTLYSNWQWASWDPEDPNIFILTITDVVRDGVIYDSNANVGNPGSSQT